jgi:hypothetical protein
MRETIFYWDIAIVNNFLLFFLEMKRKVPKVSYKVVFLNKLFMPTKFDELVCKWLQLIFLQDAMESKKDTKLYLWYCIRKATVSLLMDNRWLFSCIYIVHLCTKRCKNLLLRICETTCGFHRFNNRFAIYIYIYDSLLSKYSIFHHLVYVARWSLTSFRVFLFLKNKIR